MSDTATAPAPETQAEAPAVEQAPPGQRSTGGVPRPPGAPTPPMTRESAQDVLRQAYGRQRELQEQQGQQEAPAEAPAPVAPGPAPKPAARPAPAKAVQPLPGRERDASGRFVPQEKVDAAAPPAVQERPTQAPPRPGTPARAPAPKQPAAPGAPPAGAPPSPEAPAEEAPAAAEAPQPDAPAETFSTARWQRAFQAEPGLRRTVGRIQANPALSASQKAAQLAEKLADGERAADAAEWRGQQMRDLRRRDPQGYIRQVEADEAEAEASEQLALRITHMIAEAYEVDPADPDFLEAGPREGDDRVEGIRRFVEFTSRKSPIFKTTLQAALAEQATAHQAEIAALKAQHKLDVEAATERGRSQARSPYGAGQNGRPPRSAGSGVVPVGQDEGPGGGPRAPARFPTLASVRDAIHQGYVEREPAQ